MWSSVLLSDLRVPSFGRGGVLRPSEVKSDFQYSQSLHYICNKCIVYKALYLEYFKNYPNKQFSALPFIYPSIQ